MLLQIAVDAVAMIGVEGTNASRLLTLFQRGTLGNTILLDKNVGFSRSGLFG